MKRLERCIDCGRNMWLICECDGPHRCQDCVQIHGKPIDKLVDSDAAKQIYIRRHFK